MDLDSQHSSVDGEAAVKEEERELKFNQSSGLLCNARLYALMLRTSFPVAADPHLSASYMDECQSRSCNNFEKYSFIKVPALFRDAAIEFMILLWRHVDSTTIERR
jgi:hypothetical protein